VKRSLCRVGIEVWGGLSRTESLSLLSAWSFAGVLPMYPLYIILQIHNLHVICIVIFLSLIMQFLAYKHMESNKVIRNNQTRIYYYLFLIISTRQWAGG